MIRGIIVSLALAAGLSISSHSGNAHATVVAPSLAQGVKHSLVEMAGVKFCYRKQTKSGKVKLKCDDRRVYFRSPSYSCRCTELSCCDGD